MNKKSNEIFFLILIVFFASFLYIYNLSSHPFAIHGDEAETAIEAINILKGNKSLIGVGWYDLPLLSFFPHAIFMKIFGQNIFGDRLGSVILSIITLPFFYKFLRFFLSNKISLIATFLLATNHIWIALSRLGVTYVQATFVLIGCFYFLFRGIQKNDLKSFLYAGVFFSLCFYSYYASRIVFFIIPYLLLSRINRSKSMQQHFLQLTTLICTAIILFFPQGMYYFNNFQTSTSRTNSVFVFSKEQKTYREQEYPGKNNFEIIKGQIEKTFSSIFIGDKSGQYGYKRQLFDSGTILLFLLGVLYSFLYFKKIFIFLYLWLILSIILGQVLTVSPEPIFLPRFVVGIPCVFIFCSLGIELFYKKLKKKKIFADFTTFILITFITLINIFIYFIDYPNQLLNGFAGDPNALAATKISWYINKLSPTHTKIMITEPYLYGDFSTIKFLTHKTIISGSEARDFSIKNSISYIAYPQYQNELAIIQQKFPQGKLILNKYLDGRIQFFVYQIL